MEFCAPIPCGRCLLMVLVFLSASAIALPQETTNFTQPAPMARPGCPTQCGNLTVPYPFGIGIGSGCAFDSNFEILCDGTDYNPPRPFLDLTYFGGRSIVYRISERQIWVSGLQVINNCYESNGTLVYQEYIGWTLFGEKFDNHYSLSPENKITAVGCDDIVRITDGSTITTGCTSSCSNASQVPHNGTCSGIGCCQLPIPKGPHKLYSINIISALNHTKVWSFNPCGHMFLGDTSRFRFLGASDLTNPNFVPRVIDSVASVVDWTIGDLSCKEAQNSSGYACQANTHCVDSDTGFGGYLCTCDHGYEGNPYLGCIAIRNSSCKEAQNRSTYACQANSHCIDSDTGKGGYMCRCDDGYEGNPYLSPGCTDVDECKDPEMNTCELGCINIPGGFNCTCHEGYYGDGKKYGQGCLPLNKNSVFPWFKFFLGMGLGIFALVAMATSLCYIIKKTNRAKMRLKFFEQNGGFLLKQKITSSDGGNDGSDVTKIFSAKELMEATNNYSQDMVLGRGGNGIVFKGILPNMLQVAIKRSKIVDDTQIEQFINEVIILSRINHRHVVTYLGCCLEAEVPLLVFEYISNGTLHHHIHNLVGASDWLSWENRLRIAIEVAGALAYLHSAASVPIVHRDVKSTNILIDENYIAKISDFGASRLIPLDRTHVATLVQGTLGYLDPEYFQSGRLTEKSDVYSFGVILAELLTERRPVPSIMSGDDRILSAFFIQSMNENRLFQIIVPRLVREGTLDQLQRIAELVKRCLQLKGEDRPQMKEVANELELIRNSVKQSSAEPSCYIHEQDESIDLYAAPISP